MTLKNPTEKERVLMKKMCEHFRDDFIKNREEAMKYGASQIDNVFKEFGIEIGKETK